MDVLRHVNLVSETFFFKNTGIYLVNSFKFGNNPPDIISGIECSSSYLNISLDFIHFYSKCNIARKIY